MNEKHLGSQTASLHVYCHYHLKATSFTWPCMGHKAMAEGNSWWLIPQLQDIP